MVDFCIAIARYCSDCQMLFSRVGTKEVLLLAKILSIFLTDFVNMNGSDLANGTLAVFFFLANGTGRFMHTAAYVLML